MRKRRKKKIVNLVMLCILFSGLFLGIAFYKKWLGNWQRVTITILFGVVAGLVTDSIYKSIKTK